MWWRSACVIPAVMLLVGLTVAGLPVPAQAAPGLNPASPSAAVPYDITLPTGDKVLVSGGRAVTVTAAPRESGHTPAFSVSSVSGALHVVPDDVVDADPDSYRVTGAVPPVDRRDAEDYVTLRVRGVARDGRLGKGEFNVLNVRDGTGGNSRRLLPGDSSLPCTDEGWDDSSCIRIAPGTYSVLGVIETMPSWQPSTAEGTPLNRSFVGYPEIEITRDTELVLDARKAREVTIDTPDHVTKRNFGALSQLRWMRAPAKGPAVAQGMLIGGTQLEERVFLQPTAPVRTGSFEVYTRWRLEAPAIAMEAPGLSLSPEYYDPVYFSDVSSQFPRLDGKVRLRVVDADRPGAAVGGALALVRRSDAVSVAERSNKAAASGARMVAVYNDRPGLNGDPGGSGVRLAVPTVRLSYEEGRALLRRSSVVATGIVSSPYRYELLYAEKERIPRDLRYVARIRDLARVTNHFHGASSMSMARYSLRPWEPYSVTRNAPLAGTPRSRVDYLSPDPETSWSALVTTPENPYNYQFPSEDTPYVRLDESRWTSYRPGQRDSRTWFEAPLTGGLSPLSPIARTGDRLRIRVGLVDAAGNYSEAYSSNFPNGFATRFRFYQDDRLLAETANRPSGFIPLSPDLADYRIEWDVDNHAPWARLSPETKTVWTFRSTRPMGSEPVVIPLLQARYDADLDLLNRARSPILRLRFGHQDGSAARLRKVALSVSYDDGRTWTGSPLRAYGKGYSTVLRGRGTVSLQLKAEDDLGNTLTQRTIRAYSLH